MNTKKTNNQSKKEKIPSDKIFTKEDFLKALTKTTKIVKKPEKGKKKTSG